MHLLLALLLFSVAAQAAAIDAGSLMRQLQPVAPPVPSSSEVDLIMEGDARLTPSLAFKVKTLRISGNTLFDTPTLHTLVADAEGKTLTLTQLDELAARITGYYQSHGYPLVRAFIPTQTIRAGLLRIEIIETRNGKAL